MKLNDGKLHKMVFTGGKLYIDGVACDREIAIWFQTYEDENPDPSVLSISVHDNLKTKDVGPGQHS